MQSVATELLEFCVHIDSAIRYASLVSLGSPKLQKVVKIGAMEFVFVVDETLGISNRFL